MGRHCAERRRDGDLDGRRVRVAVCGLPEADLRVTCANLSSVINGFATVAGSRHRPAGFRHDRRRHRRADLENSFRRAITTLAGARARHVVRASSARSGRARHRARRRADLALHPDNRQSLPRTIAMKPVAVVLHGPTSAGKSSLARALQQCSDVPTFHVSLDAFVEMSRRRDMRSEDELNQALRLHHFNLQSTLARIAVSHFEIVLISCFGSVRARRMHCCAVAASDLRHRCDVPAGHPRTARTRETGSRRRHGAIAVRASRLLAAVCAAHRYLDLHARGRRAPHTCPRRRAA